MARDVNDILRQAGHVGREREAVSAQGVERVSIAKVINREGSGSASGRPYVFAYTTNASGIWPRIWTGAATSLHGVAVAGCRLNAIVIVESYARADKIAGARDAVWFLRGGFHWSFSVSIEMIPNDTKWY